MSPSDRKLVMRRISLIRDMYNLEDDSDAALMLTVIEDIPEKIRILATEILNELEPDAGWKYYSGRGAYVTPPEDML